MRGRAAGRQSDVTAAGRGCGAGQSDAAGPSDVQSWRAARGSCAAAAAATAEVEGPRGGWRLFGGGEVVVSGVVVQFSMAGSLRSTATPPRHGPWAWLDDDAAPSGGGTAPILIHLLLMRQGVPRDPTGPVQVCRVTPGMCIGRGIGCRAQQVPDSGPDVDVQNVVELHEP